MLEVIYLSNSANQDFQAIILPAGKYSWQDIWSPEAWAMWKDFGDINNLDYFYDHYKKSHTGIWTPEWAKIISLFFDNFSVKISAGESKEIVNIYKPNIYFNTKLWDNFNKNPQWRLFMRSKDGKWTCAYNSNYSQAWIIQGRNQGYESIQAQLGKVWQNESQGLEHYFVQVKTTNNFSNYAGA